MSLRRKSRLTVFCLATAMAWGGVASVHGEDLPAAAVSFELDVLPILSSRGCNAGACHGKARGQNGFQLSLLAFDPDFDYDALTKNARGRRISASAPDQSLILRKASAQLPHGGGLRIERGSTDFEILRRWISAGAPRRVAGEPKLEAIAVSPTERSMEPGDQQLLAVTAAYSDGSTRDVTAWTAFQSNEAGIVGVGTDGRVRAGPLPGEAAIMARYMNHIAICNVRIPLPGTVPDDFYAQLPRHNFIDELVWAKLRSLGITPSAPTDDARFLRRVHLDLIGRLPSPDEVRAFLSDSSPGKRAAVVDALLQRPEYADHWSAQWADLLRPNPYRVGIKAVLNYDNWIRDSFRKNKPYDQFVRELITAQGSTWRNGAATMFRDRRTPEEITTMVSQLFLGIRLECAKCHHHPFEKWGQDDFYSFAAFFGQVGFKGTGLSPPISGGEEMVLASSRRGGGVKHPLTQQDMSPRPLFGDVPAGEGDPRERLASWITTGDNPFFSQVLVNRVWAELMGRGLVDPVDDLRVSNPASNGQLLEALAVDFRSHGYDVKHLLRTICTSHVYGLSSIPSERNVSDTRNYSRHYRTRIRAEVLLDAVTDVTAVAETFRGAPAGARANQLWTTRVQSVFLDTFGRPNPNQDPPCERTPDSTVTQALHLMNAPQLQERVTSDAGRAAQLAASDMSAARIVEELYLAVYSRLPDAVEQEIGQQVFARGGATRRQATEDLMWALVNTPEFMMKD
jgi:hypothetical protein